MWRMRLDALRPLINSIVKVMKSELADECDYKREADSARFFASPAGLGMDKRYRIPWVWEGSTEDVLVMEMMDGVTVGGAEVENLDQSTRNEVCSFSGHSLTGAYVL